MEKRRGGISIASWLMKDSTLQLSRKNQRLVNLESIQLAYFFFFPQTTHYDENKKVPRWWLDWSSLTWRSWKAISRPPLCSFSLFPTRREGSCTPALPPSPYAQDGSRNLNRKLDNRDAFEASRFPWTRSFKMQDTNPFPDSCWPLSLSLESNNVWIWCLEADTHEQRKVLKHKLVFRFQYFSPSAYLML